MVLAGCTDDGGEDAAPTTTEAPAEADSTTSTTVTEEAEPDEPADDTEPALPPAPDPDPTPLPIADDIRTGVLDNGLTYYVRSNDSPGSAVALRLVVRAGGRQEDPLGTGVAHFLEHMMFNGTEAFPGNELDATLRSIGAQIGPDFNAYTSDNETVYQIGVEDRGDNVDIAFDVPACTSAERCLGTL